MSIKALDLVLVAGGLALGALAWKSYGDRVRAAVAGVLDASSRPPRSKEELEKSSGPFTLAELEILGKAPLMTGSPLVLKPGQRYRMRLDKTLAEPLAAKGFSAIWRTDVPEQLPATWQPKLAVVERPGESFASGVWSGSGTTLVRPEGLWDIWPTTQDI